MASERVRVVPDSPEPGWTTELMSNLFAFDKRAGWVLDPLQRRRWAAHPGFGDDAYPPSDLRSLLTAGCPSRGLAE